MPRAFDRRIPVSDKNPLAGLLDFENWASAIDETAQKAGKQIRDPLQKVEKLVNTHDQWPLPIGNIFNIHPNLVANPSFDTNLESWTAVGPWSHDLTNYHGDTPGSARTASNFSALHSSIIPVEPKQKGKVSAFVRWAGAAPPPPAADTFPYTFPFTFGSSPVSVSVGGSPPATFPLTFPYTFGSGGSSSDPVQLVLTGYSGDTPTYTQVVASLASPSDWVKLSGNWNIPDGTDGISVGLVVGDVGTDTVGLDVVSLTRTSLMPQNLVDGLLDSLLALLKFETYQELLDKMWQAIKRIPVGGGKTIEDIFEALQNFHPLNILGAFGPANIVETIQAVMDQLVSGFVGLFGHHVSLAELFNVAFEVSSNAGKGRDSWELLGLRNNKPVDDGLLASSEANFALSAVPANTTMAVTAASSKGAVTRVREADGKGVIGWYGDGSTGITDFRITVWRMDTTAPPNAGSLTRVHHSTNQAGLLNEGMSWIGYELPTKIPVVAGEVYVVEWSLAGSGTHEIAGKMEWLPANPFAHPRWLAISRNTSAGVTSPPATIASTAVTPLYTGSRVWFEWGSSLAIPDAARAPRTTLFNDEGTHTYAVPSWAKFVDRIMVGSGGGGEGTGVLWGEGGHAGAWASDTLTVGTTLPTGTTTLTVTIGPPGAGHGGFSVNGEDGAEVSVSGTGVATLTGAGGAGGSAANANTLGKSPGDHVHNAITYAGGSAATVPMSNGNAPGGGGAASTISLAVAGDGALGAVWIVARQ